ncbi:L-carnitine dehydrogenase [Acinetobacter baumannii]|nr:L-carnitine dehydrogenase [Acinetobacter baumannii]
MEGIKTIGVVGVGVIGASWTALFLYKGFKVKVYDPYPIDEELFKKRIQANLSDLLALDQQNRFKSSFTRYFSKFRALQQLKRCGD